MLAKILPFVSHRTRLRLRELRRVSQFVDRYGHYRRPTPDEAALVKRQEEEDRRREADWALRHGGRSNGAAIVRFPRERTFDDAVQESLQQKVWEDSARAGTRV